MKFYTVSEHYYNFCDEWVVVESYWLSEELAMNRRIEIEDRYNAEHKDTDQYWVSNGYVETED